jgi:PilZ domain
MSYDKRKAPRRHLEHRALIVRPDKLIMDTCTISDISQTGAQLELASADDCPAKFDLIISKNGRVQRRCAVVWQVENRVGVKFLAKECSARSSSPQRALSMENDP